MLAVTGTALVGLFGLGVSLLPPNFAGTSATPTPSTEPGGMGAADPFDGGTTPAGTATATGSPSSTATPRTTGTGSPTAPSPSPSRKAASTPTRTPGRTSVAPAQPAGDTREEQVLSIVNSERAANGCGAVKINSKLATAARAHSADQAEHDKMTHTGSDGSSFSQRAERAGYSNAISENVAAGYRTPAAVMEGWMNSAGHRANILNCQAKAIGIGVVAAADGTLYWTQVFGSVA
ncbi:hypothetical protein GCM10027290_60230 [Micromonospora sonneratiae]|uniref:CAP domain-containing protein n=1 Tax=Micromonospora sonneratiae TaxID=1184706 RepID=A0ABW3YQT7_9ACTN